MAVTTEIWYIDDSRAVVDFSTAIVAGVAQKRILRAKGVLNTNASTPTVGDLTTTLFANNGETVSAAKVAQAVAEKSSQALPSPIVDPGNSAGVDATARAAAAAAQTAADNASALASTAATNASNAASTATTAASNAATALSTANAAQTTANTANSTANTANTAAGNAQTTATNAATSAGNAITTAGTASTTATTANTAAGNAQTTANANAAAIAALAKVATTGVATDLIQRPLTFNQRLPYPTITRRPDLVIGTKTQVGLATIYVPWFIKVPDTVFATYPSYGRWRVYTSTDHDSGDGGIAIGVSSNVDPTVTTSWSWLRNTDTTAKMFFDGAGSQTETPCVVWNPETSLFHMYYQVASGTTQWTKVATSADGVTNWTIGNAAMGLPNPSNTIAGWNHRGYAKVFYLDGLWAAWHLQGTGNTSAYGWSFSYDGLYFVTDRRRVGAALQMSDGALRYGVSSLFHWRGELWALMSETDYVSGRTAAGTVRAGVAPISREDDLRQFKARPQMYDSWGTAISPETSITTPPPSFAPLGDGRLIGAYRLNGSTGSIALAVLA